MARILDHPLDTLSVEQGCTFVGSPTLNTVAYRHGGGCMEIPTGAARHMLWTPPSPLVTGRDYWLRTAIRRAGTPTPLETRLIEAFGGGVTMFSIRLRNDGNYLVLADNTGSYISDGTGGNTFNTVVDTWHLVELHVEVAPSGLSTISWKVDGTPIIDDTTDTIGNVKIDTIRFGTDASAGVSILFDDVAVNDETGATDNTWVGDVSAPPASVPPATRRLLLGVSGSTTPAPPPPAEEFGTNRDIPVSPAGSLGQFNLSSRSYIIANRFVLDQPRTITRWYATIISEGTDYAGGRPGYGDGNGGTLWGRIVEVDQITGLPTSTIIAQETVAAATAYQRARTEFGLPQFQEVMWWQFPAVTLLPDRMYAFLLSNVHPSPGDGGGGGTPTSGNHVSADLNWAPLSQMGPQGLNNNVDPAVTGAMYGLDPRECTMWSSNSGATWRFQDQVGWYQLGNGQGRMWTGGGYRITTTNEDRGHGWMWMNWPGAGTSGNPPEAGGAVVWRNSPKAFTITHAGGCSSQGPVGVVTVTNLNTPAETGATPSLAVGVRRGLLGVSVDIAIGDDYQVSNIGSGVVDGGSDNSKALVFGLGNRAPYDFASDWRWAGGSQTQWMPMIFATPHPFY